MLELGNVAPNANYEMERMEEEKEEIFTLVEVLILRCSPLVGKTLGLLPLCDPPSREPTHMGTSPTTLNCH